MMQQLGFRRHNNMGLIGNNEPVNARIKLNELLILHFVIVAASTSLERQSQQLLIVFVISVINKLFEDHEAKV